MSLTRDIALSSASWSVRLSCANRQLSRKEHTARVQHDYECKSQCERRGLCVFLGAELAGLACTRIINETYVALTQCSNGLSLATANSWAEFGQLYQLVFHDMVLQFTEFTIYVVEYPERY